MGRHLNINKKYPSYNLHIHKEYQKRNKKVYWDAIESQAELLGNNVFASYDYQRCSHITQKV